MKISILLNNLNFIICEFTYQFNILSYFCYNLVSKFLNDCFSEQKVTILSKALPLLRILILLYLNLLKVQVAVNAEPYLYNINIRTLVSFSSIKWT